MRFEPVPAAVTACVVALLAACSGKPTAPAAPAQPAASAPVTPSAASAPESKPSEPVARAEPAPPTAPVAEQSAARSEAPVGRVPAKPASVPVQQAKKEGAQPPPKEAPRESVTPKEPPLDLASLETRLKETKAIGVMTKIALKNQVDDLLNQFRAFYAGKLKTTLAELRRPYDLLVLKVLSLLQDGDPSLAAAIVASREAIWGILSDPVKFAGFASN
jgi:hypothetical protein